MTEVYMVSTSPFVDSLIITKLLFLVTKYESLKSTIAFQSNISNKRRRPNHRRSSSYSNLKDLICIKDNNSDLGSSCDTVESRSKTKNSPNGSNNYDFLPKLRYSYTFDQYWTMDNIFFSLVEKYKSKNWVRNYPNNPEIHIVVIRQFWLDCNVCDQLFWHILSAPLGSSTWINGELFIRAIENLHETSNWNIFTYKFIGKKYRKTYKAQKQLFFFSLAQHEYGEELSRDQLVQVLDMADRTAKYHLEMLANLMIKNCHETKNSKNMKISFGEFKSMLINRLIFSM
ncbi:unnamed protein product [Blepharisma stoltei]|uniref:Uncharacterized protein n=1 Tax=Blepharisma stoltei TaxID=1481888 RepID=A0AAU9JIA6_9CILI|nr:unnamed protein product [Blepharisma stoltei]